MANKVKLGARPESFKRTVKFPLIEGGEGAIDVTFIYRTKTEFGEFIDKIFAETKQERPADGEFGMREIMGKARDKNAAYLLEVIRGWNLDEPLNRETAEQFCDEFPGAAAEIMEQYRAAIVEGRVKN
ncbi:phage tail assembly chaperone [Azonexus sp. IMCC34839]|uniref:phage tail assembly chaperone n=1 Tax=Azonexus sp. IMCC34839 TaxID=3133695 RepID=UPI00399ADAD1